jgi:hypothetical protein
VIRKNIFLKMVALLVILGIPSLLFLGLVYNALSPREWSIGLLAWFATIALWATLKKRAEKKALVSSAEPAIALDDDARRRILRQIWMSKAWIGVLALLLPVGIANGVAHRAWLPTFVGVGMNLLWMSVAAQEIKRRRKRLNLSRQ